MFNSVEKIYQIAIVTTKDINCSVALGKMGYNYSIRIQWTQESKLRSLEKLFSEQMIMGIKTLHFEDYLLREIQRSIEYNVGKIAYEEG